MKEEFLHFVWRQRLFKSEWVYSQTGDQIQIVEVGQHNVDAGPDFFDARIRINGTLWAGNVEIHMKASQWKCHGHQIDQAYENVILHVVGEADEQILSPGGRPIPCIVLEFPDELIKQYQLLLKNRSWIPCEKEFVGVDRLFVDSWLDRMLVERLERKAKAIQISLKHNSNSWEETFYQYLARYMGMKVNGDPFDQLARSMPLKILARQKNSLLQVEALLFGQAGMLYQDLLGDKYYMAVKGEYQFLRAKYQLMPIEITRWKYLRLRPSNFPTIRIAQLAAIIYKTHSLFSKILHLTNLEELRNIFRVKASVYWDSHYRFNRSSDVVVEKVLGDEALDVLLINTVIPFLFVYGVVRGLSEFRHRALEFLDQIPVESNSVIRKWRELGVVASSAYNSQGLLQLKTDYCDNHRCLECALGNRILGASVTRKSNL